MKHRLYISYLETADEGKPKREEEGKKFPSYEPTYISLTILGVYCSRPINHFFIHEVEVNFQPAPGQAIYLVVPRYTTGSTFGSTYGDFYFQKIFKQENLQAMQAEIRLMESGQHPDSHRWQGFFSNLELIEVYFFEIKSLTPPAKRL